MLGKVSEKEKRAVYVAGAAPDDRLATTLRPTEQIHGHLVLFRAIHRSAKSITIPFWPLLYSLVHL